MFPYGKPEEMHGIQAGNILLSMGDVFFVWTSLKRIWFRSSLLIFEADSEEKSAFMLRGLQQALKGSLEVGQAAKHGLSFRALSAHQVPLFYAPTSL